MANDLVAHYKRELNGNRSDLLTAKSARQIALTQSTAPNLSDAERAKQRKRYEDFDKKVKQLEKERKILESKLREAQRDVEKPSGLAGVQEIKTKYNSLAETYNSLNDKTSEDALSLKKRMDALVSDFQKAYSKSIGTPVSLAVAKANLSGTDLSKTGATGTADEPVTLQATATATAEKDKKPTSTSASGKTTSTGDNKPAATTVGDTSKVGSAPTGISSGSYLGKEKSRFEDLIGRTEFWYNLPDYIFKVNPALQDILVKAVDGNWTEEKFLLAAQQTPWWQQNSAAIRTRIVDKAKYDELRSQGLDVSKTDYGLDSATIKRKIKSLAQQKGANLTEDQLDQITAQAYNGFLENDNNALTQLIAPYIGTIPAILGKGLPGAGGVTSTYSGEALKNYQALQDIARQNGFKLQDILPRISTTTTGGNLENAVLQKLANGELDVNAIAQNARMLAAAGQPQYVRDLLNQGYDLSAVYAPYRTAMAGVLELNPDQIDLNDPTLRMGITDKGDMNLYDYRKLLKQDNRWQYTANAAQEVSDAALRVLRDFGVMG